MPKNHPDLSQKEFGVCKVFSRQQSKIEFARAKDLMPGGVNSAARAFGAVGGDPVVFQEGDGAYLTDIDGNRYIDYIGSWGPMILGHQFPPVKDCLL